MKFIKITINKTEKDIENILSQFDESEMQDLINLLDSYKSVEFTNKNGIEQSYASIEDNVIKRLFSFYIHYSVGFTYKDITKKILFGYIPKIENKEKNDYLKVIINEFIENNLDTDTVLDKINAVGYHKLTKRDKKVLEAH